MIIKKKQLQGHASLPSSARRDEPSHVVVVNDPIPQHDPYMEASPEDFESGVLPSRRRTDRRAGYRRIEDQELITRAHEEANAIREAAAKEGYELGLNQAQDEIDNLLEAINSFLEAKEKALLMAADDLGSMAIEIAEQIIKTEVSCDDELVASIVKSTIARVGREQKSITIKVNPIDVKVIKEAMEEDTGLPNSVQVLVSEDPSVDPGSCMVESQAGLVDARFSTQIDLLKRLLLTGGKF